MGVMVKFGDRKAFLREGQWRCVDARLELKLNRETDRWIGATGGPAFDSTDPEAEVACAIATLCGGVVRMKSPTRPRPSTSPYIARRQYSFDFST